VTSSRLVGLLAGLGLLSGASAAPALALVGSAPRPVAAAGTSVPGMHVELLILSARDAELTARFRVTNAGTTPLRSRVFGDPVQRGIDRQLGRDLGGAFVFDSAERALYAPLRDQDGKVRGNRLPAQLQPGQTLEVSVSFQRPRPPASTSASPRPCPSCSGPSARSRWEPHPWWMGGWVAADLGRANSFVPWSQCPS